MLPHFVRDMCWLFVFFIIICVTAACGKTGEDKEPIEINYEICGETELPDELKVLIDEKKEKAFRLIYENSAHRYIAVGYGRQKREVYAVTIKDFYERENSIILKTLLVNASKRRGGKAGGAEVCPYIVVRCEVMDKPVVFQH
ncbi:MAG: protease complex subunit PrcB family protein [Lachnospiraceae bacterium]|nr:protease complex subunit PrcB family protein [Lachnospiraceae bacterium]